MGHCDFAVGALRLGHCDWGIQAVGHSDHIPSINILSTAVFRSEMCEESRIIIRFISDKTSIYVYIKYN